MFIRLLTLPTILLLCQLDLAAQTPTNVQDLRDWRTLGLPVAAAWNVAGYNWQYHVNQVRQGHRFLPSVQLPFDVGQQNNPSSVVSLLELADEDWTFLNENSVPICLRTQNISEAFVLPPYRLPLVPSSIPSSPLVWTIREGVLNDERVADSFGPTALWAREGGLWSTSLQMRTLQSKLTSPAYIVLLDNNEGPDDFINRYVTLDPTRKTALGYPFATWHSTDRLTTLSLRMRDRVAQLLRARPQYSPYDFQGEFWTRVRAQYIAFFAAFDAGLTAGWQGKLLTGAYRLMNNSRSAQPAIRFPQLEYAPQLLYYDAGSEPVYSNGSTLTDFTSLEQVSFLNLIPAWETARKRNPKLYRSLGLSISDHATLEGARAGWHEVMTPDRYEGFVQWLLWSIQSPGVPVLLRSFRSSGETPTTPLFDTSLYDLLDQFHVGYLKTATSETYQTPILTAVDRVCTNATLRKYWLTGTPIVVPGLGHPSKQTSTYAPYPEPGQADNRWRILECSVNPPREDWKIVNGAVVDKMKVWAVATRLGDSVLLYAWTPCNLSGEISVTIPDLGTTTIPIPQPWGYWTVAADGTATPVSLP